MLMLACLWSLSRWNKTMRRSYYSSQLTTRMIRDLLLKIDLRLNRALMALNHQANYPNHLTYPHWYLCRVTMQPDPTSTRVRPDGTCLHRSHNSLQMALVAHP